MPLGKYLYLGVVYICRVVAVGHVMISLDEEHEVLLRRLAKERHGGGKGSISAIVEEVEVLDDEPVMIQKHFAIPRPSLSHHSPAPLVCRNPLADTVIPCRRGQRVEISFMKHGFAQNLDGIAVADEVVRWNNGDDVHQQMGSSGQAVHVTSKHFEDVTPGKINHMVFRG